jgi:hypothetical protein
MPKFIPDQCLRSFRFHKSFKTISSILALFHIYSVHNRNPIWRQEVFCCYEIIIFIKRSPPFSLPKRVHFGNLLTYKPCPLSLLKNCSSIRKLTSIVAWHFWSPDFENWLLCKWFVDFLIPSMTCTVINFNCAKSASFRILISSSRVTNMKYSSDGAVLIKFPVVFIISCLLHDVTFPHISPSLI